MAARDCLTQRGRHLALKFIDWYNIEVDQRFRQTYCHGINRLALHRATGPPSTRRSRTLLRLSPSPLRYETMILLRSERPHGARKVQSVYPLNPWKPPTFSKFVARTHWILDRSLPNCADDPSRSATCPPFSKPERRRKQPERSEAPDRFRPISVAICR